MFRLQVSLGDRSDVDVVAVEVDGQLFDSVRFRQSGGVDDVQRRSVVDRRSDLRRRSVGGVVDLCGMSRYASQNGISSIAFTDGDRRVDTTRTTAC